MVEAIVAAVYCYIGVATWRQLFLVAVPTTVGCAFHHDRSRLRFDSAKLLQSTVSAPKGSKHFRGKAAAISAHFCDKMFGGVAAGRAAVAKMIHIVGGRREKEHSTCAACRQQDSVCVSAAFHEFCRP